MSKLTPISKISISKTYPSWLFDGSPIEDTFGDGERAIKFIGALRHPASTAKGKAFTLPAFWERVIRRIEGPRHPDGSRVVRTCYVQIPRGARKTTIGAALGLLHTLGYERRPNGRSILAAGAEDQAELAYEEAAGMVRSTPMLAKAARIVESQLYLEHPKSGSELQAIPADGDVQHGKTPYFVLVDELHIWKNRRLWKAIKTGLLKTPNTLLVIITTAGRGQECLAFEEYAYARKVAEGSIDNPAYLPVIFEPPAKYDWKDEAVWHLVNPGLGKGFPDLQGMRQAAKEAEEKPADRDDFRQYNLNEWLDHSASPFVEMAVYDDGADPVDLAEMEGLPCWLGVDLSSSGDLTAVVACWRDGDTYYLWAWFFCPKDNLARRQEQSGQPYTQWAKDGLITATPGNVVDLRAVEQTIRDLCDRFDVREIAFDPALAHGVQASLQEDGYPVVSVRQGAITMMPMIAALERVILGRNLTHGGHPILRWNFANVETETNTYGHKVRFTKGKRYLCIDGAVAASMAVGRASLGEDTRSVYADSKSRPHGLLIF